jgi:hypothetical protein
MLDNGDHSGLPHWRLFIAEPQGPSLFSLGASGRNRHRKRTVELPEGKGKKNVMNKSLPSVPPSPLLSTTKPLSPLSSLTSRQNKKLPSPVFNEFLPFSEFALNVIYDCLIFFFFAF